jgi:hypothetical protein
MLCYQHARELELELEGRTSSTALTEAVAKIMGGRDPVVVVVGAINGAITGWLANQQARTRQGSDQTGQAPETPSSSRSRWQSPPSSPRYPGPGGQQRPRPPPSPPPPKRDPILEARTILGFEPDEPLTIEKIQTRKQALARVFHPDRAGGSLAQMKRVNVAADTLLAKIR